MNLILQDNSAQRRSRSSTLAAQRVLRQAISGKPSYIGLFLAWSIKVPPWLHQTECRCPLPPIWPLRSIRSLPIPPLGSSGLGRVQSGAKSSTVAPWVALQKLDHQRDSHLGSLIQVSPRT